MPVEVAAPVAVLASIAVASISVLQDWRHIHLTSALWLIGPTLAGIPLGLLLLTHLPEREVKSVLGALIIAFSAFCLLRASAPEWKTDRHAWIFGFAAGALGGAYGMNGPPLVIYGSLRRWSPQHFRATLQAYFFVASIVGMAGYAIAGLWTAQVTTTFSWSLPGIVLATFLGRAANRRLHPERFLRWVHVGLLLIGAVLVVQSAS